MVVVVEIATGGTVDAATAEEDEEFISNLEGRLTAVKESTARTAIGGIHLKPSRETYCRDRVDGENSDRGIHLKS